MYDLVIKNVNAYVGRRVEEGIDIGISDGKVASFSKNIKARRIIEGEGLFALPGLIDPHTHTVFAGNRSHEFALRAEGARYEDIARAGGGILATVKATRTVGKEVLYYLSKQRIYTAIEQGTTTMEIKSGYGSTQEAEFKMLEVINLLKTDMSDEIDIVPTFLAHAIDSDTDRVKYVNDIIRMLEKIKEKSLCEFVDVFMDVIAFNKDETERILTKAKELGFKLKLHADEIEDTSASILAAKMKAVSADHLLKASKQGLEELKESGTVPVLLPATAFFLKESAPDISYMRRLALDFAIGSDFNPGSSFILSQRWAGLMGIQLYNLTVQEAIDAITVNAAKAIDREDIGNLELGFKADVVIFKGNSLEEFFYNISFPVIKYILKHGRVIREYK